MLYAILAYHVEGVITALTPAEDAALMSDLHKVHDRLNEAGKLGPAARLGATAAACTLRGPGRGMVIDGPFAETKEQLLGFYVVDCADLDEALGIARDLALANPGTGSYEIRPMAIFDPGVAMPARDRDGPGMPGLNR